MKTRDIYDKIKEYCDMVTMYNDDVSLEISPLDIIHTYSNTGYTFNIKMSNYSPGKFLIWSYVINDEKINVNSLYRAPIENISSFKGFVNGLLPKIISDSIDVVKVERLSKIDKAIC